MSSIYELPPIEKASRLTRIREEMLMRIVLGEAVMMYSEWLLRGTLGETFRPTIALAVFPTLEEGRDLQYVALVDAHRPVIEYWREIDQLELPQRIRVLETIDFAGAPMPGEQTMKVLSQQVLAPEMPSSIMVFSRPEERKVDSAYLFAPTIIPPSVAFRQIAELAKQHLESVI